MDVNREGARELWLCWTMYKLSLLPLREPAVARIYTRFDLRPRYVVVLNGQDIRILFYRDRIRIYMSYILYSAFNTYCLRLYIYNNTSLCHQLTILRALLCLEKKSIPRVLPLLGPRLLPSLWACEMGIGLVSPLSLFLWPPVASPTSSC
jgi:hypothetical protein